MGLGLIYLMLLLGLVGPALAAIYLLVVLNQRR